MASFTIHEWRSLRIAADTQSVSSAQRVSESTARELHALAERERPRLRTRSILTRTAQPALKAGQVVGVLSVPGATLEILPKIDGGYERDDDQEDDNVRRALIRMLAVAFNLRLAEHETESMSLQHENLLEAFVGFFADSLLTAVRRGLPHRYRRLEEDLPYLKGKLDIRGQLLRNCIRSDRLACIYDELSPDTNLNRTLYAAVQLLRKMTNSEANGRKLRELVARFESVSENNYSIDETVQWDRSNDTFKRLYVLARLFLERIWQDTSAGKSEGFALLFPMNELFEEYIGRSVQWAVEPSEVELQRSDRSALKDNDKFNLFKLKPDIFVAHSSGCKIIVDTKWKRLDPADLNDRKLGVTGTDVYQLLAYGRAYRANHLVLLYPWHEKLRNEAGIYPGVCRRWQVNNGAEPTTFNIATVDVGERTSTVRDSLRGIVDVIAT